jgi:hypothetical protein
VTYKLNYSNIFQTKFKNILILKIKMNLHIIVSVMIAFFWWYCGLNTGPHTCWAGDLPLNPHVALVIFWDRLFYYAWAASSYLWFFQIAGITDTHHCAQPLCEVVSWKLLPWLASNFKPLDHCLLSSWDYRLEPLYLVSDESFCSHSFIYLYCYLYFFILLQVSISSVLSCPPSRHPVSFLQVMW